MIIVICFIKKDEYLEKSVNLPHLYAAESPWVGSGYRYIYKKGVPLRFDFDVLELRNFKLLVKDKATGTPRQGVLYTLISSCRFMRLVLMRFTAYMAWGFQRCSFRLTGQCEGLNTWDE